MLQMLLNSGVVRRKTVYWLRDTMCLSLYFLPLIFFQLTPTFVPIGVQNAPVLSNRTLCNDRNVFCAVQYGGYWPHVTTEQLKCLRS